SHSSRFPLESLEPATDTAQIRSLIDQVRTVHVAPGIRRYVVDLVNATRTSPELSLGASPRATLHLVRAARAYAALDGRHYVVPHDAQVLAVPVLAHRLLPGPEAQMERLTSEQIVAKIIARLPVPGSRAMILATICSEVSRSICASEQIV